MVASILMTIALSLSSFSQAGFLLNMQVRTIYAQLAESWFRKILLWYTFHLFLMVWISFMVVWPGYCTPVCGTSTWCVLRCFWSLLLYFPLCDLTGNDYISLYILLTGISNSAGTLAAIVSTIGTGYFVQWLGSFQAFLSVTACLYFATAIFWNLYATGERVF